MRRRAAKVLVVCGLGVGALLGSGCGAAKEKAVNKALEGSDVQLEGLGKEIPSSFPAEVPIPTAGTLETAVGVGGMYTLRYGITDPRAATTAYRDQLVAAGFTVDGDFDNLEGTANNVGFTAVNGTWSVTAVAFDDDPTDGLYQAIVVQPAT